MPVAPLAGKRGRGKAQRTLATVELATEINTEHERAFGKAREALEHARRAGELLLQAKAATGHGAWIPWIEANCQFSVRQAQRYMTLAENWPAISSKYDTASHLTLTGALRLLSEPKPSSPYDEASALRERIAQERTETREIYRRLSARDCDPAPLLKRLGEIVKDESLIDEAGAIEFRKTNRVALYVNGLLHDIDPRIKATPNALHLPEDLTLEQWTRIGQVLAETVSVGGTGV